MFLADIMMFGPLEPCPECKTGQLLFKGTGYYCTGNITEWTNCAYRTQVPKRIQNFQFCDEIKEEFICFKNFKFQPGQRLFAKSLDQLEIDKENVSKSLDLSKQNYKLKNLKFSSAGRLGMKNSDIKLIIERNGGMFTSAIDKFTVAVISTEEELEKNNKKIRDCQEYQLIVVSENFLQDLQDKTNNKEVQELIKDNTISSWIVDLSSKIESCKNHFETKFSEEKSEKYSIIKSIGDGSGKLKMKIVGGAVVDPETNLQDEAHVLLEQGTKDPYTAVLGLVDITRGTNSYYKMQIIEHDKKAIFYLFRAWGRVGTTIGGNKLEHYSNKNDAIENFCSLYLDKTGNTWFSRKYALKQPNKFYPLEMDYGNV